MIEFDKEKEVIESIKKIRKNRTKDIATRTLLVTAQMIKIKNFPVEVPVTLFNPSILAKDGKIRVFGRIVTGYFTYASAIVEFDIDEKEALDEKKKTPSQSPIPADITLIPDSKYDMWGVEDPRVFKVNDYIMMTYCGRTINYFSAHPRIERTLPVTAVCKNGQWSKKYVFRFSEEIRTFVVSDKDAFVVEENGKLYLFHRPHMLNEKYYMVISELPKLDLSEKSTGIKEVLVSKSKVIVSESEFESKLGWSTPPVHIDGKYITLVHAVDRDGVVYRAFALAFDRKLQPVEVTPFYIMEPKEIYELYGERPLTIFPCGAQLIDEFLVISYGCADFAMGIAKIPVEKLLKTLSQGKI